jgi:hypothetical protein
VCGVVGVSRRFVEGLRSVSSHTTQHHCKKQKGGKKMSCLVEVWKKTEWKRTLFLDAINIIGDFASVLSVELKANNYADMVGTNETTTVHSKGEEVYGGLAIMLMFCLIATMLVSWGNIFFAGTGKAKLFSFVRMPEAAQFHDPQNKNFKMLTGGAGWADAIIGNASKVLTLSIVPIDNVVLASLVFSAIMFLKKIIKTCITKYKFCWAPYLMMITASMAGCICGYAILWNAANLEELKNGNTKDDLFLSVILIVFGWIFLAVMIKRNGGYTAPSASSAV